VLNPHSTIIEKLKWSAGFRMFLMLQNALRSAKTFMSGAEVGIASDSRPLTSGCSSSGSSTGLSPNGKMPSSNSFVGEAVFVVLKDCTWCYVAALNQQHNTFEPTT